MLHNAQLHITPTASACVFPSAKMPTTVPDSTGVILFDSCGARFQMKVIIVANEKLLGIGMCKSGTHNIGSTEDKSDGTLVHLLLWEMSSIEIWFKKMF